MTPLEQTGRRGLRPIELRDGDNLVFFGQKQQLDEFESDCAGTG